MKERIREAVQRVAATPFALMIGGAVAVSKLLFRSYEEVSAESVVRRLPRLKVQHLVVDFREEGAYEASHVRGARQVGADYDVAVTRLKALRRKVGNVFIIAYDAEGKTLSVMRQALRAARFSTAQLIDGGYTSYVAAGGNSPNA